MGRPSLTLPARIGRPFTTWTHCTSEPLAPELAAEAVAAVERAGFRYVPAATLNGPYTGRHPAFVGSSW